ncbi:Ribosomal RNA small subunit methyltransferase E [Alloactinosynnema sp. L-07]|uniref:16S rRNA (uracil(1498)-N(3))-methyltransferase n=1 Tax=Alloactinosynnema sp. L-07 TaxID=1653480 RepID=UPI00065F0608|nr:16S rRNA (uracil(1498)-N(3))-methyltransferase [Alloactinosynnema sp. L-07]CRK55548.1 Ribosomal RNA small subunit methyltransferase E [Alloactinosynnema sp. L-07]
MTLALFLIDDLPSGPFTLDGPEGRHAAAVRRLRVGEELLVSDGRGAVAHCVVAAAGRDSLDLTITRRWDEPPPSPRVIIAQALAKGDRGELAVELATEAGADEIIPWRAACSITKWDDGPRGDKALTKWRATVREAAKQARRAWIPIVTEPMSTRALVDKAREVALTLVLEAGRSTRMAEVELPESGDVLLIVGPEGGITEDEINAFEQARSRAVRLGPAVLRTSTAAAVALGAIGVRTARWR